MYRCLQGKMTQEDVYIAELLKEHVWLPDPLWRIRKTNNRYSCFLLIDITINTALTSGHKSIWEEQSRSQDRLSGVKEVVKAGRNGPFRLNLFACVLPLTSHVFKFIFHRKWKQAGGCDRAIGESILSRYCMRNSTKKYFRFLILLACSIVPFLKECKMESIWTFDGAFLLLRVPF